MVDVIPYVHPDGTTIDLTVIATVKEFMGYDLDSTVIDAVPPQRANVKDPSSVPPIIGPELSRERPRFPIHSVNQSSPRPVYRMRQILAPLRLSDGQTAVLAGGVDKLDLVRPSSAPPSSIGDRPLIGRLLRAEHAKKQETNLVVLVTARIVDPAGNPVRSAEEVPVTVPPQPVRREK